MSRRATAGHRSLAHTADLRIEAWAPDRERCLAEAVAALVDSFAADGLPAPVETAECELAADRDEDLLVAVLDEVIFRLETTGRIPAATEVSTTARGVRVRFAMAEAAGVTATGAIPKAVSLHELALRPGPDGWSGTATIDV